jgi:hypothetical protein
MAGVGPLGLAAAVRAVALVLDGQPVKVIGLDGRQAYPHESNSAWGTVSVHLGGPSDVDRVAGLLGMGEGALYCGKRLYGCAGDWQGGVHVSLFSGAQRAATVLGVVS